MKKPLLAVVSVAAILVCICSCSRSGKVIPRSKLAKIYAEMFVVDAWLDTAPYESRRMADTLRVYEPIFREYGYTTEDYRASVSYYLQDPDRFSRILKKTGRILGDDIEDLRHEQEIMVEIEELRRKYRSSILKHDFTIYDTLFDKPSFTDRIEMVKDDFGRYLPVRVLEDTSFFGPRIVLSSDIVEENTAGELILPMEKPAAGNRTFVRKVEEPGA